MSVPDSFLRRCCRLILKPNNIFDHFLIGTNRALFCFMRFDFDR